MAFACIGIYKSNSKPEIKNATKTVSSDKSKNNKKTIDIKPENKSRETEEKEEKVFKKNVSVSMLVHISEANQTQNVLKIELLFCCAGKINIHFNVY